MQGWLKKVIRLAAASRPAKKHKGKETQWNLTRPSSLKNLTKARGGLKSKSRVKNKNTQFCKHNHLARASSKMRKQNCKMIKPTQQPRLKQKHAGWQTRDVRKSGKIILPSHLASHLAQSPLIVLCKSAQETAHIYEMSFFPLSPPIGLQSNESIQLKPLF